MGDLFSRLSRPDVAEFSDDAVYRYVLTRELGGDRPLVIVGLNPSTATAEKDDRTIARETDFAKRWKCGRLWKVNAYAFIDKDPDVMFAAKARGVDIIGAHNDARIIYAAELAKSAGGIFLVAWGKNIEPDRELAIERMARGAGVEPTCLKTNLDGSPTHPLYLPKTLVPKPRSTR